MEDDAPIEVSAPIEIRFNLGDPDANLADAFDRSIGQAREALATKDYAEAERNARQALEDANDRPGHKRLAAEAEYVLAQIALAQDRNARPDFDACIRLYREASGDNELPPSAEVVNDAFYAAGTYYFNEADDRSAENTLTLPVIAWNSTGGKQKELAIAAALLGQARFRLGDLAGAARACEIFRSHEKALRGLELDAARQRCSAIR